MKLAEGEGKKELSDEEERERKKISRQSKKKRKTGRWGGEVSVRVERRWERRDGDVGLGLGLGKMYKM